MKKDTIKKSKKILTELKDYYNKKNPLKSGFFVGIKNQLLLNTH